MEDEKGMKDKTDLKDENEMKEGYTLEEFFQVLVEWLKVATIQAKLDSEFTKDLLGINNENEGEIQYDEEKIWPDKFAEKWV